MFFSPYPLGSPGIPLTSLEPWNLRKVLRSQSLLFSLDLSSNEISDLGASALLKALEENFVLLEPWENGDPGNCVAGILVKRQWKDSEKMWKVGKNWCLTLIFQLVFQIDVSKLMFVVLETALTQGMTLSLLHICFRKRVSTYFCWAELHVRKITVFVFQISYLFDMILDTITHIEAM